MSIGSMFGLGNTNQSGGTNTLLGMVLNNRNNKGKTPGMADFLEARSASPVAANLANTMNSFAGDGPGSVEVAAFPGLGYSRGAMTRLPQYNKSTVEHDYLTKSDPAMNEKDYAAAIKKLAEKNAAAGIVEDVGDDYFELARSFVSVVSPDRKAIIAGASSAALVPEKMNYDMASAYDDDGNLVATYNPTKGWTNRFTEAEKQRNAQFDAIYWSAYNAYTKANQLATPDTTPGNAVVGNEAKPTTVDVTA